MTENQDLCIRCGKPVASREHFCPNCSALLTTFATTAPYETFRAQGDAFNRALSASNQTNNPGRDVAVLVAYCHVLLWFVGMVSLPDCERADSKFVRRCCAFVRAIRCLLRGYMDRRDVHSPHNKEFF